MHIKDWPVHVLCTQERERLERENLARKEEEKLMRVYISTRALHDVIDYSHVHIVSRFYTGRGETGTAVWSGM